MAYELRLSEADRERFDRGDEWFRFDLDELFERTPVGVQEDIEDATNYTLTEFANGIGRGGTKALRWRLWVARYLAGVRVTTGDGRELPEPFDTFDPAIRTIGYRDLDEQPAEVDASPPEAAPDGSGPNQDAA